MKTAIADTRKDFHFKLAHHLCDQAGMIFVEDINTSQVCPNCDTHTGKKDLSNRLHSCPECGYTTHRDVAAAQVVRNRGTSAVGRIVDASASCLWRRSNGDAYQSSQEPTRQEEGSGESRF